MTAQHTPGPWFYEGQNIRNGDGLDVATVDSERSTERCTSDRIPLKEWTANTRLIAAAPEMLEALRFAGACLDATADGRPEDVADMIKDTANMVYDAIAKAEE